MSGKQNHLPSSQSVLSSHDDVTNAVSRIPDGYSHHSMPPPPTSLSFAPPLPPPVSLANLPPYIYPTFDYSSRTLIPPMPEGNPADASFLSYQTASSRTFHPTPFPPPAPTFPYGLPAYSCDKSTLPAMHSYRQDSEFVSGNTGTENETELINMDNISSSSLQPLIPPTLQSVPPSFPLIPPPPPPNHYFPTRYPPTAPHNALMSFPPPSHHQDLLPCDELVRNHFDSIPVSVGISSNPVSPAPSAMLSPNTSKLLQSALESDADSIMALSPGTEQVPSPIKADKVNDMISSNISQHNDQSFSQYEVEIQKVTRDSEVVCDMVQSDMYRININDQQHHFPTDVYNIEHNDDQLTNRELSSYQYTAMSPELQVDQSESLTVTLEENSTNVNEIQVESLCEQQHQLQQHIADGDGQHANEEDEDDDEDSESDDEDDDEEDDEDSDEEEDEEDNSDEVDEDKGVDKVMNDEQLEAKDNGKYKDQNIVFKGETTSNLEDVNIEIPKVDSPFTRIRPSLLKSYRASKKYRDKKRLKKSRISVIFPPVSPYESTLIRKKRKVESQRLPGVTAKVEVSEIESEIVTSADDFSEIDTNTPHGNHLDSSELTPGPIDEVKFVLNQVATSSNDNNEATSHYQQPLNDEDSHSVSKVDVSVMNYDQTYTKTDSYDEYYKQYQETSHQICKAPNNDEQRQFVEDFSTEASCKEHGEIVIKSQHLAQQNEEIVDSNGKFKTSSVILQHVELSSESAHYDYDNFTNDSSHKAHFEQDKYYKEHFECERNTEPIINTENAYSQSQLIQSSFHITNSNDFQLNGQSLNFVIDEKKILKSPKENESDEMIVHKEPTDHQGDVMGSDIQNIKYGDEDKGIETTCEQSDSTIQESFTNILNSSSLNADDVVRIVSIQRLNSNPNVSYDINSATERNESHLRIPYGQEGNEYCNKSSDLVLENKSTVPCIATNLSPIITNSILNKKVAKGYNHNATILDSQVYSSMPNSEPFENITILEDFDKNSSTVFNSSEFQFQKASSYMDENLKLRSDNSAIENSESLNECSVSAEWCTENLKEVWASVKSNKSSDLDFNALHEIDVLSSSDSRDIYAKEISISCPVSDEVNNTLNASGGSVVKIDSTSHESMISKTLSVSTATSIPSTSHLQSSNFKIISGLPIKSTTHLTNNKIIIIHPLNHTTQLNEVKCSLVKKTKRNKVGSISKEHNKTPKSNNAGTTSKEQKKVVTSIIEKAKKILPKLDENALAVPEHRPEGKRLKNSIVLEEPLLEGPALSRGFFCVECNKMYPAGCTVHENHYKVIQDSTCSKARASVPPELLLRSMYNQDSSDFTGVISRKCINARTKFGPLQGKKTTKSELVNPENTAYVWEIFDEEHPGTVLDCRNEDDSNWLMFVKRARSAIEQNMLVYQEGHSIYFITIKDIMENEELLYWYGRDYAVLLGVCNKPEDSFQCQSCHRQFPEKSGLALHYKTTHPLLDSYIHKCNVCGKVFKNQSILNKHQKATHSKVKSYICPVCNKAFNDRNNQRRHSKLHSDDARKFKCNECDKAFTQKTHLIDHIACHTGELKFPCRFCDKRFAHKQDSRFHEKTVHIIDQEYKCGQCDQVFYSLKYYKAHSKVHREAEFECHVCQKKCRQKGHLKVHLARIHKLSITTWEDAVKLKAGSGV